MSLLNCQHCVCSISYWFRSSNVSGIRSRDLIPGCTGLRDHLHGQGVLIGRENLIVPAGTVSEVQGAFPGFRSGEVSVDPINLGTAIVSRRRKMHPGSSRGRYRSPEDASLDQPLPFPSIVDRMNDYQFIFTIQGLGYFRSQRRDRTVAIR